MSMLQLENYGSIVIIVYTLFNVYIVHILCIVYCIYSIFYTFSGLEFSRQWYVWCNHSLEKAPSNDLDNVIVGVNNVIQCYTML